MCTILNDLALALGLELNLRFATDRPETFYEQAHLTFELITDAQTCWKPLYAFFITTGYARRSSRQALEEDDTEDNNPAQDEAPDIDSLPPQNRRFDLHINSGEQLLTDQTRRFSPQIKDGEESPSVADRQFIVIRSMLDHVFLLAQTILSLDDGIAHDAVLPYDEWDAEFRDRVLSNVAFHGGWRLANTREEVESFQGQLTVKASNSNAEKPTGNNSSSIPTSGVNPVDATQAAAPTSKSLPTGNGSPNGVNNDVLNGIDK